MTNRRDAAHSLARRVARAARHPRAQRTLLVDLDGTLAPIAPSPDDAAVPERTLEALDRLVAAGWRLAVVSGRPRSQARSLVPVCGVRHFGSHGMEGSWSGRGAGSPVDAAAARRIRALTSRARRLAAGWRGVLVESKPAGVALHDRAVAPGSLRAWRRARDAWLAEQDLAGLERLEGKRVLELRPRGAHKGRVARAMPRRRGAPRPDASLVALGDDVTDEDLFREIRGRGLAVRIGRPGRRSAARTRLASPLAVERFLTRLADLCGAGPPARGGP